ncbi:MAG: PEP-CTERM sorting domain-containing protein [Acidobacteriia bacterium]|nr:PEP-CTERM sorting domain-containing protein [Terriglobia bacterium]
MTAVVTLASTPAAQAITISVPAIDFGLVPLNTQVTVPFQITADAGFEIISASGALNAPFGFNFGTCAADLSTCQSSESFLPTTLTTSSDTLNIFECPTGGGSCLGTGLSVSGTGYSVLAALLPAFIDFGHVPINTQETVPFQITADAGFEIISATGGLNPPFGFDFGACAADLSSCLSSESFLPTTFTTSTATLSLFECPTAGGDCLGAGIPLFGSGISVFSAIPASVDFGNVPINTQVNQFIDITADAGFEIISASGALNAPFGFDFGTCAADLSSCLSSESFLPTTPTTSTATLSLFECPVAGGTCPNIDVPIAGSGVVPEPSGLALFGLIAIAGRLIRRRVR